MAGGGLQRAGIVWPWVLRVHRTFHGLWHDLNLRHALASLAVGCADAVASGVATANHEHMLAFGRDALIFAELHPSQHAVLLSEHFQGEMHSFQLAARNVEVACGGGSRGDYDRIVLAGERFVAFHGLTIAERDAFFF